MHKGMVWPGDCGCDLLTFVVLFKYWIDAQNNQLTCHKIMNELMVELN